MYENGSRQTWNEFGRPSPARVIDGPKFERAPNGRVTQLVTIIAWSPAQDGTNVYKQRSVSTAFLAPRFDLVPELDAGTPEQLAVRAMEALMNHQAATRAAVVAPDLDVS